MRETAWYDAYLGRGGADRSADTIPGNEAGGLSNIVEKAMGSFRLVLEVASGRRTWSGTHRLTNALVLFNPAPVTGERRLSAPPARTRVAGVVALSRAATPRLAPGMPIATPGARAA